MATDFVQRQTRTGLKYFATFVTHCKIRKDLLVAYWQKQTFILERYKRDIQVYSVLTCLFDHDL